MPARRHASRTGLFAFLFALPWACAGDGASSTDLGDLGGGKADFVAIENLPISIPPADGSEPGVLTFSLRASGDFVVTITQETDLSMSLGVTGGGADIDSEPATEVREVVAGSADKIEYTLEARNHSTETIAGLLSVLPAEATDDNGLPTLDSPVVYENDFCIYQDTPPYVAEVKWNHPKIVQAMRRLGPGWRSTYNYYDWRVSHGLEASSSGTNEQQRNAKVRNFIRVLCGEYRDYPEMLEAKLDVIGQRQVYAGPDEVTSFDLDGDLFSQITFPAYERMVQVMGVMHRWRQSEASDPNDGFHYGFDEFGHDSQRVENSVPPWTHCEMKYMFSRLMVDGAPRVNQWASADTATEIRAQTYEAELAQFRDSQCSDEDLAFMYNFRGHNNYKALWLESNAFIWNSRRGRKAKLSRGSDDYYLRPWADRHTRARSALGAYLFPSDDDFQHMRHASDWGGGPIMYVTDQDLDDNQLADYRLFPDDQGCGDQGVGAMLPDDNCNMVSWQAAADADNSQGHVAGWDPSMYARPDMGFMEVFDTFSQRMARINQALDRHTNWGPTSYYMLDASDEDADADEIRMIGAYSPIVACSYDISASDWFARRDFVSNSFESGMTKWMFIMKFPTANYYDEKDLADGREIDFFKNYFNETSMSNDYYSERALDRFGFVPKEDIHAVLYFVYGDRGEQPPALEEIPAP